MFPLYKIEAKIGVVYIGRVDVGGKVTAKNIIIATGSVPFVPPGIPIDGKTVSLSIFIFPCLNWIQASLFKICLSDYCSWVACYK